MSIVYFQTDHDDRCHELNGETPARLKDKTLMGLLQDMPATGDTLEVYLGTDWVSGWIRGEPNTYKFEIECVSFEDERTVHGAIHDGLIKYYSARSSPLPWHKIIPPSKQCNNLPDEVYVVIAREDRQPDGSQGRYTLATRAFFKTEEKAKDYAVGISSSREPLVIPGRFNQMRKSG